MLVCVLAFTARTHSLFFIQLQRRQASALALRVDFWFVNCLSSFVVFPSPFLLLFPLHVVCSLLPFSLFCLTAFSFFFGAESCQSATRRARSTWPALCPPGAAVASPNPPHSLPVSLHPSLHLPLPSVRSFWPELLLLLSALVFIPATYTASQAASPCHTLSSLLLVKFSSDWFCVAAFACFLARRRRRQQRNGGVFFRVAAAEWAWNGGGAAVADVVVV